MAIGEAGSLQGNTTEPGQAIGVTFTEPLDDPVIALTSTNTGGHKFSLRVIEVQTDEAGQATGFTFTFDEWENHDGQHPAVETVNWLAVEAGTHVLPDGRVIEAGHAEADSDGEAVGFTTDFDTPPVVLTTVASDRHASHVDSDPSAVTGTGFTLSVQEAESQDGLHGLEQVGWIAIEPGAGAGSGSAANDSQVDDGWSTLGLGADFDAPVVLAETQTLNDTDTGNVILGGTDAGDDTVRLRFEEDTSADRETDHAAETLGLVAFEAGLILCFTAGTLIATPQGPRPVEALAVGDGVITRDNGIQDIRWRGAETLDAARLAACPTLAPVRIPAGAFGFGRPGRDTWLSPQHRVLVTGPRAVLLFGSREVLAPAKALASPPLAPDAAPPAPVTYVHLLFDRHEIVFANDLPMESFHPGQMAKSALLAPQREELFRLFPDLRTAPDAWGPCARPVLRAREARLLRDCPVG
jgi:hypothetical protein